MSFQDEDKDKDVSTLRQLALQGALTDEDLVISVLEYLPIKLFPLLFEEAFIKRQTKVVKAMVMTSTAKPSFYYCTNGRDQQKATERTTQDQIAAATSKVTMKTLSWVIYTQDYIRLLSPQKPGKLEHSCGEVGQDLQGEQHFTLANCGYHFLRYKIESHEVRSPELERNQDRVVWTGNIRLHMSTGTSLEPVFLPCFCSNQVPALTYLST
ncbi:hypothetical protein STEG23_001632 [Scotinomys teguina]